MRDFFQDFILNQFVVGLALIIILGFITRWAVMEKKEYPGYGLGWLISILFLVIYTILFGDRLRLSGRVDLNVWQILLSIALGLISGLATQYRRFTGKPRQGNVSRRNLALQVALYTTVNLILLGLVIVESSVVQRMIGIYGLALGVAVLLGIVWGASIDDDQVQPQQQQMPPPQQRQMPNQPPPNNRYNKPQPNFKNRNSK